MKQYLNCILFILIVCGSKPIFANEYLTFNSGIPSELLLAERLAIDVSIDESKVSKYRYKLNMPGDWKGGLQYAVLKWSSWESGKGFSIHYDGFNLEGKYEFVIEYEIRSTKKIEFIRKEFKVYWEDPDVRAEAFDIDLNYINSANSEMEKFKRSADEYYKAYEVYYKEYLYQFNLLNLEKESPEEIVEKISSTIVTTASSSIIASVGGILAAKVLFGGATLYALVREGYLSAARLFRISNINTSLLMASASYAAYEVYDQKYKELKATFKSTKPATTISTIGLILDSSGSMRDSDPNNIRTEAARRIIEEVPGNENIYIVDFDNTGKLINPNCTNTSQKEELYNCLGRIDSDGGTNIASGLSTMKDALNNGNINFSNTAVILLTDGRDGSSNYISELEWYKQNNIPVYTVSYKNMADASLMEKIAFETSGIYFQANTADDIWSAFSGFYNGLRGYSLICSNQFETSTSVTTDKFYLESAITNFEIKITGVNFDENIDIIMPDGNTVSAKSIASDVVSGYGYVIYRFANLASGNYQVIISAKKLDAYINIDKIKPTSPWNILNSVRNNITKISGFVNDANIDYSAMSNTILGFLTFANKTNLCSLTNNSNKDKITELVFYKPGYKGVTILSEIKQDDLAKFTFEVSALSTMDMDLEIKKDENDMITLEFSDDQNQIDYTNSKVEIQLAADDGTIINSGYSYKNGTIHFVPTNGQGNYKIEVNMDAVDKSGNKYQRFFRRSILVDEFTPGYIGIVTRKIGGIIYTNQGKATLNRPGINAEIFSKESGGKDLIGKGHVTYVTETGCTIEITQTYKPLKEGDIVMLDIKQWSAD